MNVAVLDLETSMKPILNPWMKGSYLSTIGLQLYRETGQHAYRDWVYNHDERDTTEEDKRDILYAVQEEIDRCDMIVGHNLKFDLNWLKSKNVVVDGKELWDTMIAEYMLTGQDREVYGKGMQDLSSTCIRHGISTKTDIVKTYWDAGTNTAQIPLRILLPYQKNDIEITAKLFKSQYVQMKRKGKMFTLCRERNYSLHAATELEINGFPMNRELAEQNVAYFGQELEATDAELRSYGGRDDLNIDSGPDLSALLFGGRVKRTRHVPLVYTRNVTIKEPYKFTYKSGKMKGQTVTKYKNRVLRELTCKKRKEDYAVRIRGVGFTPADGTETTVEGVFQTNKDVLKALRCNNDGGTTIKHKRRVLELLVYRSKIAKFTSTFVGSKKDTGLFNNVDLNSDGIPHPNYNQTVAKTGRWTSSNPNGQNFPRSKEDEDGFTNPLKQVFVPSREGGLILVIDLSQLEWRVAAWLSQDPVAMQEIIDGVDCHLDNAINFFGDAKYRQDAKIMTFRLLYGGGAYAFYMDYKMPDFTLKKWNDIVNSYRRKYAVLTAWQEDNISQVPQDNGYLFSPTGRMYKIPMEEHKKYPGTMIYKATCIKNYPVQGTATADIMPIAMNLMWDRMNKRPELYASTNWMGQVHDSILFDTMPHEVKRVAHLGITVFEDLPRVLSKMFNINFNLPLTGEAEWGPDYGTMTSSVEHKLDGTWEFKEAA